MVLAISLIVLVVVRYSRADQQMEHRRGDQFLAQALEAMRKGDLTSAEYLFNKALAVFESAEFNDVTKYSSCLVNLAECYTKRGDFSKARATIKQMLDMWNAILEKGDSDKIIDIDYFAATAEFGSGVSDVADFYRKLIDFKRKKFGARHSEVYKSMILCSRLLSKTGDKHEAEKIEAEAQAIKDEESQ